MDTSQPTSPTSPLIDLTTPPQPLNYTSPEARALATKINNTHSPDALITLLNTLPPFHPIPIDYPKRLLDAASFRDFHPSKIEILFSRLVDMHALHPDQTGSIETALFNALSAASRTLNVPGSTLLLRLGADPWTDAALADKEHPLLMAVGQVFPLYAGDKNGLLAVGAGVDPFVLEAMDRFADMAEEKRLWRGEVRAIAVHLREMVEGVLLRGALGREREGFRRLMRAAQERYLVALRRMVIKGVIGMGVEGVLGDATLKGDGKGRFSWEYEGVWWREGLTPVGLRKRLREEGMLLEEGLVEVWGELVRVAGGVLVKGRRVEGKMELYVLLVEGKGGKYEGGGGEWDHFF